MNGKNTANTQSIMQPVIYVLTHLATTNLKDVHTKAREPPY